ncbi:MAG: SH3 domain-containing protein [Bacteriovoracia bacterium]
MAFPANLFIALGIFGMSFTALADQTVTVTSSGLNVRTAGGAILCEVSRGSELIATGRADSDWIKVKVNARGCPAEGFVHSAYIKAKASAATTEVDTEGLSFRSAPNLSEESYECALPKGTKLIPTADRAVVHGVNTFIKVKLPNAIRGCPNQGWVSKNYLKARAAAAADLVSLPQIVRPSTTPPDNVPDCNGAGCNRARSDSAVNAMTSVSNAIGTRISDMDPTPAPVIPPAPTVPKPSTFVASLQALIKNPRASRAGLKTNRGLVQIPLLGRGNVAPCGSNHYQPDQPVGNDVYANPVTACVLISVLQDWRKICPDRAGCTLQFGDISDRSRPLFNSHRSHTQGYCIDIRPPRKGGFADSPVNYTDSGYDKAMARKLINLLKSKGVNTGQLFFNDTSLGTRPLANHSNHIHACFPPSAVTRNVCANLKVDPKVCPELP